MIDHQWRLRACLHVLFVLFCAFLSFFCFFLITLLNVLGLLQVVNKMDRPALNGFEIIEQLEKEFGLPAYPVNWSGSG